MKAREMMTRRAAGAIVFLGLMVLASGALAGVQAGYSEYYIPGDEDYMMLVLDTIGANDQTTSGMHAVIAIVAGSDNTTVYYDHWEDGYDFNPDNPATADQTVALNNKGDSYTFESTNIPLPRTTSMTACGGGPCYDGRDRIYVAGGATTVTRASWTEQAGTLLAVAWEVYPVRPQLTTYILPFGEDLASGAQNLQDFDRVFALIQATADGTQVQVDLDHNGTYDPLDWTRDGFADGTVVNLDAGEVFLLDRVSALSASLNTGTRIEGNSTLQIQYIIGDQGDNYEIRGLSAFPRGFWDDEYYAPVDGANPALNDPTDIYLHNPNAAAITISYQTTTITGSFDIDPHETVSFGDEVGSYVPVDSAVYMKGTAPFWGISTIDTAGHTTGAEGNTHDWGYSLVPAFMLAQEHYMGWAPGAQPVDTTGADRDDSGIFITSATDNTRVFIDEDNDGAYDFTYTLNRLQTQYVWDTDGDLSEANIWATGPIAIAYGQNPETAPTGAPAIDVGYTTVPGTGLVELVLTVDKQTDPVVLPTTANEDATYTLMVGSYDFEVDNVSVVDTLPAGWSYQTGTAFITLADKTTDTTNPSISGQTLTWGSGILGSMEPNQQITIVFTARNTIGRAAGDLTRNTVDATGHRTVGGVTQDFVTSDFVFNTFGDLIMEKSTLGTDPLSPGDTYSYSITVINPFTAPGDATGIAIYDPVPAGVGYVAGSSAVTSPSRGTTYFNDFESGGQGFTTGADDGTPLMNWELGAPATVSPPTAGKCATNCYGGGPDNDHTNPGTNCWGTDLNDLYSLSINSGIYLYSPIYDFSNDASVQLSYWEWLEIEGNTYDYARLQCNVNGGGWTTVWTFGESAGAARTDSAWSLFVNNATSYAAGKSQVQWRWMISTDGSWQWGGWYIDDVKVQTTTQGPIRVTEYYLGPGTFTGTTYDLTLNQDLAQDYFVIVRGSGGNNSNARAPNVNYAALASDPLGTGDLAVSGANNRIGLTRGNAVDNWVGVVTVVECTSRQATDGFKLLDVQRVAHTNAAVSGTDTTGTAWTDINQVMLMGGFYGAGCDTAETQTSDNKNVAARIWPSGANTINWTRDAGGANSLTTATSTVMAVEWGSEWTVQRVRVQTNNGGNGVDATGEYGTTALTTSVARDHTWVWGTGHTNDNGVGDGPEGVVVTLGDGVNQNATETTVACGIEVNSNAVDFEVYALTHPNIQVDYRFKPDGDSAALTYDQAVDNASGTTSRMALVYNGCNNTNNNYPRPIFSARYLSDTSVRLERRWSGEDFPAWVQGIQFTIPALSGGVVVTAGGDPPGLVSASDGYSLAPGESLTLTYTVTVRDPLPTGLSQILNTAWVSTAEMPLPMSDSAVNQVVNPSSASASVGDYVWLDADGDGVQDAGESGLANVTVTLKDQYGTPLLTTLTNATGRYLFTGVSPGTGYWAEVTAGLPAGLFQSSPSGHSDKRTNPFDLAAGQAYLDADLGFAPAPGTATIGDRVWSDADSDRIQDAGEPGISGVIVELYLDDGDGIPEVGVGGDDTYVTSSVTGPGGLYLFAGVTASGTEDYFALVDVAQASLTGYTYTTGAQVLVLNLDAGDAVLNADFGFNNPSNATIKDRVWLDPDEDGNDDNNSPDFDDNAETGIPGITVELRDASSFVIASTTTAADGTFRFSGVEAGGADYNIRITDTAGVLTDYFATTVPAAARTLAIDNLSADLDFTTEPSEPNFGFNIEGTIGDTVFNDVDGDGTQDAGEPGMGGVAVRLYGDTDGDGILDGGEPLLATVTTNSAGGYLFSGLDDGKYIVSIPTPPAGFDYTSEGGGGDLDPAAGDQQPSTITGGGTDLARDFGYKAQVARSVSGFLWEDDDADGVADSGEARFQGVTVILLSGATTVGTTSSDASGNYSFAGLTPGVYTVRVTDDTSLLNSYDTTFEMTEGVGAGTYDSEESADATSADVTGIRFGFREQESTVVTLSALTAKNLSNGRVAVRWETSTELNTLGFFLFRVDPSGAEVHLGRGLLPALSGSRAGARYSFVDDTVTPGTLYTYRLQEVDARGPRRSCGLVSILAAEPDPADAATGDYAGDAYTRGTLNSGQAAKAAASQGGVTPLAPAEETKAAAPGTPVKIQVNETGAYFLSTGELAVAFSLSEAAVRELLATGGLSLSSGGAQVAWTPVADPQGLAFYGLAPESPLSPYNVYWLSLGTGLTMAAYEAGSAAASGGGGDDASCFLETASLWALTLSALPGDEDAPPVFGENVHAEEDHYEISSVSDDPEGDFWIWETLYAGWDGWDIRTFPVRADHAAPGSYAAALRVNLQAGSDTAAPQDHHARVYVNGTLVGEFFWDGTRPVSFSMKFDQALLIPGDNQVMVAALLDPVVEYSVVYVDSLDLSYQRLYIASGDRIRLPAGFQGQVSVGGFSDPRVLVLDVSDPARPRRAFQAASGPGNQDWSVGFSVADSGDSFEIRAAGAWLHPVSMTPDEPSDLRNPDNGAEHLIITPRALVEAARVLAVRRTVQGLPSLVVALEDVMDEFNHGVPHPLAIRDFLEFAVENWRTPPRFMLLAGKGTLDYRDCQGFRDNLVPPLAAPTPDGLYISDNRFAAVAGQDRALAVGRLPVTSAAELSAAIQKIIDYESGKAPPRQVLMAADNPDTAGDFPLDSDSVAALVPLDHGLTLAYLDRMTLAQARQMLFGQMNAGAVFMNYIGHGGLDRLASEGLFTTPDVSLLNNGAGLPVMAALTCAVGGMLPGYRSLSEALVLAPGRGAIAMWAPTGLSINEDAVTLNQELFRKIFQEDERVLGEAVRKALDAAAPDIRHPFMLEIYNLFGDPALTVR